MKTIGKLTFAEVLAVILLISAIGSIGIDRFNAFKTIQRDQDRKVSINTIHHNLLEVVKPSLGGYPRELKADQLTAMDKSLLKDPNGAPINSLKSDFRYEPTGCNGSDVCSGYTLRAKLENEVDFIKSDLVI